MIESLVLPVLVLLVPVVLVFSFAGCGELIDTSTPPDPPPDEKPPTTPPDPPVEPTPTQPMPGDPYRAAILAEPGVIGYWRLAETTGTVAFDSGPLGRAGVYQAGPTLGQQGALAAKQPGDTAVLFDGVGQLAEIAVGPAAGLAPGAPDGLLPPMSFSLEAWVRLTPDAPGGGATAADTVFDSIALADGVVRGFQLFVTRGSSPPLIHGVVGTGVVGTPAELIDEVTINLPADLLAGTWGHLVLTHESGAAGKLTLYLSYVDSASGSAKRELQTATVNYARDQAQIQPVRIGAGQDAVGSPGSFFPGRIDEVALYNTVMPPGRVNAHFDMSLA